MSDSLIPFQFSDYRLAVVEMGGRELFPLDPLEPLLGANLSRVVRKSDAFERDADFVILENKDFSDYKALAAAGDFQSLANPMSRSALLLTESGFWLAATRSNQPAAKPLRDFVTREVLPSIRRHGCYPPPAEPSQPVTSRDLDPVRMLQQTRMVCREMGNRLDPDSKAQILAAALERLPWLPKPVLVLSKTSPAPPVQAQPVALTAKDEGEEPDDGIPTFGSEQAAELMGLTADRRGANIVSKIATRLGYRGEHKGVTGFSRLDRIERGGKFRDHWKYSTRAIDVMREEHRRSDPK